MPIRIEVTPFAEVALKVRQWGKRDVLCPAITALQRSHDLLRNTFNRFSHQTATAAGSPFAFLAAAAVIIVWGATGPIFHFSDTWQLIINTGTTIITFLMVFLIQNTQNRDSQVMQLKLNELIRAVHAARNDLVDLEELSDEELHRLQEQFSAFHRRAVEVREKRHRNKS
jgi:low affinity Fe/Cu permease